MIGLVAIVAFALIVAGVVLGVMVILAVGIHREERAHSFTNRTSDRVARGTRATTGLYTRM